MPLHLPLLGSPAQDTAAFYATTVKREARIRQIAAEPPREPAVCHLEGVQSRDFSPRLQPATPESLPFRHSRAGEHLPHFCIRDTQLRPTYTEGIAQ